MIEIRTVSRVSIPNSHWGEELKARFSKLNGDDGIMIFLPRHESYEPILNAFYKLAMEYRKKARSKKLHTQLGTTLYLWMK